MKTMRAIVFQEEKNFDSMKIREISYPEPKAGEAVVEIKASALNRRDVWITEGLYSNIKVPIVLGSDGAGIVRETGKGVDKKWQGKEVIINPCLDWGDNSRAQRRDFRILGLPDNGTQAECVAIPATNLAEKPAYLSFEEAAAIPLGGLTGYRALFTQGKLAPNETLLLTGIGGGVAALMMQMALAFNVRVLVTSGSDEKIALAMEAGATGGANYKAENWPQQITELTGPKGVDLIVDSAGGDGVDDLIGIAKPGGRLVFYGATVGNPSKINLRRIYWKQLTLQGTAMGNEKDFSQMVHFFESYQIKPLVDGVYPFSQFRKAYQRMMKGEQFGKIVLTPDF